MVRGSPGNALDVSGACPELSGVSIFFAARLRNVPGTPGIHPRILQEKYNPWRDPSGMLNPGPQ